MTLPFRLLDTHPAAGAWNMALDEALMDSVRAGAPPVLRFYRWAPSCLSLGRNQPALGLYDRVEIARRGIDVVRRPTGGRAVLHARELTYSVIVGERSLGTLRQTYGAINRALLTGVHRLGVPAVLQPPSARSSPIPSITPCFRDPTEGEVVVAGRKLIGSAQYRHRGVILQHGSLLLADDQAILAGLCLDVTPEVDPPPAVLADHCDPLPSWKVLTEALACGWRAEVGGAMASEEPRPEELERARVLREKHLDVEWIWRR